MNKLNQAFDRIKAEEELKENTLAYLERERARREGSFGHRKVYRMAYALASFVLVLGIGMYMGYALCIRSVSYIEVGMTTPVELGLNHFGTVVYAETYDSQAQFDASEIKGKTYQEAIGTLLSEEEPESHEGLYFAVVSENGEELADGIRSSTGHRKCHVDCYHADDERVEEAKACALSVVKYDLYTKICAYEPDFELETCRSMTTKELRTYLKECENHKAHTVETEAEDSAEEHHEEEHHGEEASEETHSEVRRHEARVHHTESEASHDSGEQHGYGSEHASTSGGEGSGHGSDRGSSHGSGHH